MKIQLPEFEIPNPFDPTDILNRLDYLEVETKEQSQTIVDMLARLEKVEKALAQPVPTPIPSSNLWKKKLGAKVIHANSQAMVTDLVRQTKLASPNVNIKSWTMPTYVVHGNGMAKIPVTILDVGNNQPLLKAEFAKGLPIPPNADYGFNNPDKKIQIIDLDTDTYYELQSTQSKWVAKSGAIHPKWSESNGQMPRFGTDHWNSGTATWLPMISGLFTIDELKVGVIPHALSMCIVEPLNKFVWPAKASDGSSGKVIPEGTRFTLPDGYQPKDTLPSLVKMIIVAIRDYGIFVIDRGGSINVYGEDPKVNADLYLPFTLGKKGYEMGQLLPWADMVVVA